MHKVYLLLRNNRQEGPLSLEELIQLGLKPYDLIWVEGRSAAWRYPGEIEALKPYVPETAQTAVPLQSPSDTNTKKQNYQPIEQPVRSTPEQPALTTASAKHIYVSLPGGSRPNKQTLKEDTPSVLLEKKAEELSRRIQSYAAEMAPKDANELDTRYSRSVHDVEEEYTNWVYKQKQNKKKKISRKQLGTVILTISILVGLFLITSRFIFSHHSVAPQVLTENKTQTIPVSANTEVPISEAAKESQENSNTFSESKEIPPKKVISTQASATKPFKQEGSISHSDRLPSNKKTKSEGNQQQRSGVLPKDVPPVNADRSNTDITPGENTTENIPEKSANTPPSSQTEKKKKLGDIFKGVFAKMKHKKEEGTAPESQSPPEPGATPTASGRNATRRDDHPSSEGTAPQTDPSVIADQLEITANERSDQWMMGVNDLKLTLHNGSNAFIQTATVEVSYYDENNRFLEKKLVYFNNIPPKGKLTLPAPEQKWADHTDQQLKSFRVKE